MTDLSRGARARRGGRRPGWLLLTALLVLAIGASSALVFTNRAELLKLAVILALWAAVVAAFVSVIYRRQSDVDQARARDLKLVYDLQLDREISARREYELTVESQLRRELASELRAQADDEVSALRAELAALRTNLEILFDAELSDRPALETERRPGRGHSDWDSENEGARERVNRVASVRAEEPRRTDDSSIIDVHEEPLVPTPPRQPAAEPYHPAYTYQPAGAYAPPGPKRAAEAARRHRTQTGMCIGTRATGKPKPGATRRSHPKVGRPRPHHLLRPPTPQSVSRKAGAGPSPTGRRRPAVGPRRGHLPQAGRSDSNLNPNLRGGHTAGPSRLRSPSRRSCRRPRRPNRHRNCSGRAGRRHRRSLGIKSSRPGSRSLRRDNGRPPVHLAAIGIPVRATAPERRRGPTTMRRHAINLRTAHRAPTNPRRRMSVEDGIPAAPPKRRQARPANP